MSEHDPSPKWDDVDAAENSEQFTEYLETVTGLDAVRAYKRRSHHLLQPTEGDRILDVGCGTGDDVLLLAELVGPEGEVVGIDNSEAMVQTAQEQGGEVPTVQFDVDDALDLSFADDSFDAARADRVLQHLDAPAMALAELRRVTRPGGRVSVSDPDWETNIIDAPGHSEQFLLLEYAKARNPTMGRQLYRLAREAGLDDLEIDTWTPVSTEFSFIKEVEELEDWTDAMQAAGEVTETEVNEWLEGLREADEQDALFGSITGYTVAGTVPGRVE